MNISNNNFSSIEQMTQKLDTSKVNRRSYQQDSSNVSFYEILQKQTNDANETIKFSKHANQRIESRNIDLSDSQMQRLEEGTELARQKGVNETVVCVDDYAFIVNVKSNTVITAMGSEDEKIFTNIDGAVIV